MPGLLRTFAAASLLAYAPFARLARVLDSTFKRMFPTLNVWFRQHRSSAKVALRPSLTGLEQSFAPLKNRTRTRPEGY